MKNHKTNGPAIWVIGTFLLMASLVLVYQSGTPADAKGFGPDNNTPQPLPFAQNWDDRNLIISNDNWSGVPGIEGYFLRNDGVATTGIDPRTILGDTFGTGTTTVELDVLANQVGLPTSTLGGVAEFHPDAQGNPFFFPTVGLQPDATVDAPFLVINLNTTGRTAIEVGFAVHDIDCGADDAVQPVASQFRVGNTGNFTNFGFYQPDATFGPNNCTTVSFMGGTLPAAANNQPLVQIRIITTNAVGSDEWISVDFIEITGTGSNPTPTPTPTPTPPLTPTPSPSVRTAFDFDGDGKSDLSVFRPSVGEWYYQRSTNGVTNGFGFGTSADKPMPVDFTGDGLTDIAFFRPSTSEWFVLRSEDSTYYAFPFGANGDYPTPAFFDGDDKADPAVYRPAIQTWFILKSTGGVLSVPFGLPNDVPVPADYDGDGMADIGIYRPDVGQWWIQSSIDGTVFAATFGSSSDKPVPGDYTGDRKADVAFWRPSEGSWYVLRSEDQSFYAFPFGANGDKPAPGDYDRDGNLDPAVFRPLERTWYILKSTGGVQIQQFGLPNDIPLPGAFVP